MFFLVKSLNFKFLNADELCTNLVLSSFPILKCLPRADRKSSSPTSLYQSRLSRISTPPPPPCSRSSSRCGNLSRWRAAWWRNTRAMFSEMRSEFLQKGKEKNSRLPYRYVASRKYGFCLFVFRESHHDSLYYVPCYMQHLLLLLSFIASG